MDLLSSSNFNILKSCAQNSSITDDIFQSLLEFSYDTIFNTESADLPKEIHGIDLVQAKQIHSALIALILESVKTDVQNDQLSIVLDDCGFSSTLKEKFTDQLNIHRSDIRKHLFNIGHRSPHIVNLDWRLDYNIKNNYLHKIDELRYTISLIMADGQQIEFTCSREELQDFSGKLKEAVKAVERATQV